MNRREFTVSAIAAFGLAEFGEGGEQGLDVKAPAAIAEGGMLTPPKDKPIQVNIAVSHGTTWIDFVGPLAVFETFHHDPVEKKYKPRFTMSLVSEKPGPAGKLLADYAFEAAPTAQIALIPAQPGSPALLDWIKQTAASADVVMSVCTGAAHLARAGLLDGQKATTHHKSIDRFAKDFPAVHWISNMRFVEGKKVSTGGGLTAGIELALRITERYFGREWAQEVAEHLEYQGRGWIV